MLTQLHEKNAAQTASHIYCRRISERANFFLLPDRAGPPAADPGATGSLFTVRWDLSVRGIITTASQRR